MAQNWGSNLYLWPRINKKGKLNYDPNRHVRKFNKERTYTNGLSCFTCGGLGHFAKDCPQKNNIHNKQAMLVSCINKNIIPLDDEMSDNESVFSIVSYPIEENNMMIESDTESIGSL